MAVLSVHSGSCLLMAPGWPRAPVRLKGLAVSTPTCSMHSRSELEARDPVTETVGNRSQSDHLFCSPRVTRGRGLATLPSTCLLIFHMTEATS